MTIMDSPGKTDGRPQHGLPSDAPRFSPALFWAGIAAICIVVAALSWTVMRSMQRQHAPLSSLPKLYRVTSDLKVLNRSGETVHLSSLRGKVHTVAHLYTVCPHGCAAVVGEMLKLQKKFGSHPDFHQVSVTVLPERDTVDVLDAYARGIGLEADAPWWFVTGDRTAIWMYMMEALRLAPPEAIPKDEQLNPLDTHTHDLRIVLIDREGYVRGYYAVFHPQAEVARLMCDKLQTDAEKLLRDVQGQD